MCSSSSQEKINPQQLLFHRKRFTDFNMPAKKKKIHSQFDSFASLIGNGGDGWFPTELPPPRPPPPELGLNLTALPLDGIQVSRRWQGHHSLSPSGLLAIFLFWRLDKMCLILGWFVFESDEPQNRFSSEDIKCWRPLCLKSCKVRYFLCCN